MSVLLVAGLVPVSLLKVAGVVPVSVLLESDFVWPGALLANPVAPEWPALYFYIF